MINLKDDGTIEIDFPEPTGLVTLRPPKFGAYRRLQNERQREIGHMNEKVALLPKLEELPDRDDRSEAAIQKRVELTPIYQARVLEIQDLSYDALGKIWKLILIGSSGPDGDFAPLASPVPSEDQDEWPIELLVDAGDLTVNAAGEVTRTTPTILDSVLRHWGKARYRSGPTAQPAPVPTT